MLEQGYGIMPKALLYDQSVSSSAKLLFVEISSLCADKGYCWANNQYLAEKFGVTASQVSRWISQLKEYLVIEDGTDQRRRMTLRKNAEGVTQKAQATLRKKRKHINTNEIDKLNIPPVVVGLEPQALEAFHEFTLHRKQSRKPLTPQAIKLIVAKLQQLAPNQPALQVEIINQSIERGWQGVFPLNSRSANPNVSNVVEV